MKRLFSIFFICLCLISCLAFAENPSPTVEDLYKVYGAAKLVPMTEDEVQNIHQLCPWAIDFIKLNVTVDGGRQSFFQLKAPTASSKHSWFLIDETGIIVANLLHVYKENNWYYVTADFWPDFKSNIYYLIWVE